MPSAIPSYQRLQNISLPPLGSRPGSFAKCRTSSSASGQSQEDLRVSLPSADIRHGLRTPPKDMSGLSVNPLLAPTIEGCHYKTVPALASNAPIEQSNAYTVANTRYASKVPPPQTTQYQKSRSREIAASVADLTNGRTLGSQERVDESSIVSYLQIPSSINESKGSLAEFAAQVRIAVTGSRAMRS